MLRAMATPWDPPASKATSLELDSVGCGSFAVCTIWTVSLLYSSVFFLKSSIGLRSFSPNIFFYTAYFVDFKKIQLLQCVSILFPFLTRLLLR